VGRWDDKFDRAARRYATFRAQEYSQHDRVLTRIIEDKARRRPDHVVFQFRDDPLTLGDFNERINKVANGLLAIGVKPGEKVAIMLPNCAEFLYTWFGANKVGAVEVPINVALKGTGLAYQIDQSDSVVLVADTEYLDRLGEVLDGLKTVRHVVFLERGATPAPLPRLARATRMSFAELIGHSANTPDVTVHYSDVATILYTSGTTGVSKGVQMSHHYWYDIWMESVKYARYTDEDVLYT
jgi:crotonobetaine/carnitine-CoA ligase